jgi:hypothetical protein
MIIFVLLFVATLGESAEEPSKEESSEDLIKVSQDLLEQLSKPVDLTTRDPFTVSQTVHIGTEGVEGYEFYPAEGGGSQLPKLKLRGYIGDETDDPIALLDIENQGVFMVRKGDTVGLQIGGRNTVLKIKDITQLSVLVEVGTIGQVVIVR